MKNKVLFINLPSRGGLAHYANEFCNSLVRTFGKTVLLTLEPFEISHEFRIYDVKEIFSSAIKSKWERLLGIFFAFLWESYYVFRERPGIVFINAYQSPFDYFFVLFCGGKTNIYCIQHEIEPRLGRKHIGWFQKRFYKQVLGLIVHKHTDAETLLRRKYKYTNYLFLIDQGFYQSNIFGKKENQDTDHMGTILSFGTVRDDKGIDLLLEAYPGPEMCSGKKLIIAGKNNLNSSKEKLDEMLIKKGIRWIDEYIPLGEIASYYQNAAFIVLPFLSGRQSGTLRLAIFFEKPSIVTDTGELPHIVRKFQIGLVVPPGDTLALKSAIINLSNDDALLQKLRYNVKALSHNQAFSWNRIVSDLVGKIEK